MMRQKTRPNFKRALGTALVCVAVNSSAADTAEFASEVNKFFEGAQVIELASGDLDGDGAADVVALVRGPAPDDAFHIVILRAQGKGFVEWARSRNVGPFRKGMPALSVEKQSIMFDTSAATCCERSKEHHQFQLRDGRFRLIGATVQETSSGRRNSQAIGYAISEVSFNLLTGDRVEKLTVPGRKAQLRKSREAAPAPRWLEDFSGLLDDTDLARVLTAQLR